MQVAFNNSFVYWGSIAGIILLSFVIYSSVYFPLLNSDHAIPILQIHSFEWPNDIYFWGQDRMGSLIPLLGQLFKPFGVSAIWTEAIVHYSILMMGFFCYASFITFKPIRVLFALFWFLPPMRMLDFTQLSFGIHYSLIGILLFGVFFYRNHRDQLLLLSKIAWLSLFTCLGILTVWVSDLSAISLLVILVILAISETIQMKSLASLAKKPEFWWSIFSLVVCFISIRYAKNIATVRHEYTSLVDLSAMGDTLVIFGSTLLDLFLFRGGELLTSIYAYLVLIFLMSFTQPRTIKWKEIITHNPLITIIIIDGVLVLGAILLSDWTLQNGVPRRYFTCTYFSIGFAMFLLLDQRFLQRKISTVTISFFLLAILIGSASGPYSLRYEWPGTLQSKSETVRELEQLGSIGIIGDYWNAYIHSVTSPDKIKSTPYELSGSVRNLEIIDAVFEQERLFLIKDLWMNDFPDTLQQFGRTLIKSGEEFHLANSYLCAYRHSPTNIQP